MRITRRTLLSGSVAFAGAGLLPRMAWANTSLSVGTGTLDMLSDGHLVLPRNMVLGANTEGAEDVLAAFGLADADALTPDCNLTLWRDSDRVVLFDAGSGPDFMPSAGELLSAMDAIGLAPEAVTDVIFTHAHPDHLWGVLDDFDEPLFVNATHYIGQVEWDYWTDPALPDTISEDRLSFVAGAARRLAVLADGIVLFEDGDEVVPGVIARATHGHTPGHMSFEIASGDETLLVLGDCIANQHLAFARPDLPNGADQDVEQGIATRTALLNALADSGQVFAGFHLPSPGIGRAERDDAAFRYVPQT